MKYPVTLRTLVSVLLVGFIAAPASAEPAAAPTATTRPVVRLSREDSEQLRTLIRRAVDLLKQRQYEQAERVLEEALQLNPLHHLTLYNLACAKAMLGKTDQAMDCLERAAMAGFTDFIHIEKDPDLDSLRSLPRYRAFVARKEDYQRRVADLTVAWLQRELGDGYLFEVDEKNKLIFATNTDLQTLQVLKKRLLMQAHSLWKDLFEHRPDQYISIVLPSPIDYRQIISRPGVGGLYNHEKRILIARRLGQVMTHEFTHALHNADLDPLDQEHPPWISEGLATLFEPARFEGERLIPADSSRLGAVQASAKRNRLIPLRRLVVMDQKAFTSNSVVTLTYGQSGSLMLYLYENNLLRRFYDTYKATYDRDKTGRLALEQVTGQALANLESDWKEWMLRRTAPPRTTGPNGAILGVRFAEAHDGLRIDYIQPNSPAQQAGLRIGDTIVGIDELDIRDANSLVLLLATRNPGDTITLEVRRGQTYLELPLTLAPRNDRPNSLPASRRTAR